ncbi:MAG: site-specific DNA-methyltransferase, partial [candidate division SR1 bacterium]|nr:site-specific DNA-methyltransferase [candidate division SR1 bacterium]
LLLQDLAGNNQQGTTEIQDIFGDKTMFSFPKPKKLLNYLISKLLNKHSTILDFFAGSGTTGHAVLELNKQDGGARQFILCSNSEATAIEPEKNICRNITYERVKRVMQGYKNAKGEAIEGLGGGNLRYYTTDFIKKEKSTDDLRQKFIYLCDELLCIKEDTFIALNSDYCSDQLRCYYKSDHYTVILYDLWQMDKLQQLIAGVNGQVSLYLFSLSKDAYEEELLLLKDKVKIENVPDDILETYHKIF